MTPDLLKPQPRGAARAVGTARSQPTAPASLHPLEVVYRTERGKILRYLNRRVGRDVAPDLVQEIFARAFGSHQADQLANPIGFIRRITRNVLIDRARRRARNPVILFDFDDQRDLVTQPDQTWAIEAADLLRAYNRAVADLPEKTRRVFLMHRLESMSYRQIAAATGTCIGTVEYHMKRALTACRAGIAAYNAGLPYLTAERGERS